MRSNQLKWSAYFLVLSVAFWLSACAQINPLQGGEKDNYAPRIDSVGTYPINGQTNFSGSRIEIKFTEYIALNKPADNILITPQLATKPTYIVKNKKLIIDFADTLTSNTTYSISFNHAITDITEKNDSIFQYVFSTGDYIDSLTLAGSVRDAFTNKAVEGYLIGLFSTNTTSQIDSIPFLDRPIYITQTNSGGDFKLNYLKEGVYHIYAIKDVNKNLRLDPNEDLAFMPEGVLQINDSTQRISMLAFQENAAVVKMIRSKFEYPGKLTFIFNQSVLDFSVRSSGEMIQERTGSQDSLVFWLGENPTPKMEFITNFNEEMDTIKPLYKGMPTGKSISSLSFTTNLEGKKLVPKDSLRIRCSEPIGAIDPNGIHCFTKDSVELEKASFKIVNCRTILFDQIDAATALISIDSGAVQSFYKESNPIKDWISIEFLKEDYYGTLMLNIDSAFKIPVLVQLLNTKNEVIAEQNFNNQLIFEDLPPGKYQVRLILDENGDGEWTTGDLKEQRMPERVIYNKELIDVKSNWEKEVDWLLNE